MRLWKISPWQAMTYLIATVLATSILSVPAIVTKGAGANGLISLVIALTFGTITILLAVALGLRNPQRTVIEYAVELFGFIPGKLVGIIFVYYYLFGVFSVTRQFQELMSSAYLPKTPPLVFSLCLILLSCFALYLGLEVINRANSIVIWVNILGILCIVIIYFQSVNWLNLRPDYSIGFGPIVNGALTPVNWFGEIGVMVLILIPFIKKKPGIRLISLLALLISFILLELVLIVVVGNLGTALSARSTFPFFTLLNKPPEYIQSFFFQPSVLFMTLWISGMFMKVVAFHFASVYSLAQWFGLRDYLPLVLPCGALCLLLSIVSWPSNIALLEYLKYILPFEMLVNFILILLLYLISLIKGPKRPKGVDNS